MENIILTDLAEVIKEKGYESTIQEVVKNNTKKNSLCIHFAESPISPTLYEEMVNDFAKDCSTSEELADKLISFSHDAIDKCPALAFVDDTEVLKENVTLGICKREWNQELLKQSPYEVIPGTDLCIYPRVALQDASVRITNSLLDSQHLEPEEVLLAAKENVKSQGFEVTPMEELLGIPIPDEAVRMVVISNESRHCGAVAMTDEDTMNEVCERLGTDSIVIIPSSVHEVIAVPYDESSDLESLRAMIQEVNSTELHEEERLSDQPYVYDNDGLRLAISQELHVRSAGRAR